MDIVIKIHDIPQNDHERWVLKNGTPLTERPKGKWISVNDNDSHGWGAYKCHVCSECKDYYTKSAYEMKYCPNCGAEMIFVV